MKKKILIISIICILCIAILISCLVIKKTREKTNASEPLALENDLISDESISNVEKIDENLNNIVESEQNLEETNSEEKVQTEDKETITQSNLTQNKTSSKSTSNQEIKENETPNETKKENTKQESSSTKPNTPSTVNEQKQETKVTETPTRCTNNNNHSMEIGNSGQWFSNKNDAIAYYNSKISYWGNLWETEQIDDATYYKNCPSGYEIWDCAYCSKWTINFYYR